MMGRQAVHPVRPLDLSSHSHRGFSPVGGRGLEVELFQQFNAWAGKPLKRLDGGGAMRHRAKATVLMRAFAGLCSAHVRSFVAPRGHPLPQNLANILLPSAVWNNVNGNR